MGASFFQDTNPTPAAVQTINDLVTQATAAANTAITQANTATTDASTATTEAGVATTQAGLASTSATNAATSETNAAASASAAAGSASSAATSATNASTSATNAVTSETNAANSATAASNSASAAATSATNAATSETNAANSATAAANSAAQAAAAGNPGTNTPTMDGVGSAGSATTLSRSDHQHPSDTSRAPVASPTFTGTPAAPTPAVDTNTTQIPTTAWVLGQVSSTNPNVDGTAAPGTSTRFARADHVHPTDTSRAPLASPAFTGTPTVPTPASGDNSQNIANTAFSANNSVRADITQALTTTQRSQILANTGAVTHGFVNKLRNGAMDVWQRGTSIAVNTSGQYTADGWFVLPTGASVTVSQGTGRGQTAYSLKITGASGVTDVQVKQPIESVIAARLAGRTVTFQAQVYNGTGASITPTLTVKRPSSTPDSYTSTTTDISSVSLQSCPNGAWTQVAYTFTTNSGISSGMQVVLDFGASLGSASNYVLLTEVDLRSTDLVTNGLNSAPPNPELRFVGYELQFSQRYYELISFANQVIGSSSVGTSYSPPVAAGLFIPWTVQKRVTPTVTSSASSTFLVAGTPASTISLAGGINGVGISNLTGSGSAGSNWTCVYINGSTSAWLAGSSEIAP